MSITLEEAKANLMTVPDVMKATKRSIVSVRTNSGIPSMVIGGVSFMLRSDVERWSKAYEEGRLDGRRPQVNADMLKLLQTADLGELNARVADCVRRRYGLHGYRYHTLDQIGKVYGISRERARQLVKRGTNIVVMAASNG